MERDTSVGRMVRSSSAFAAALGLGALLCLAGCGGGGGGGGGGSSAGDGGGTVPDAPAGKVTISGAVKDTSEDGGVARLAPRLSYAAAPAVAGVMVEVLADLDDDGVYSEAERFVTQTDSAGNFSVNLGVESVSRVLVKADRPGYTRQVQELEDLTAPVFLVLPVSPGDQVEVDLGLVGVGPARAGRMELVGDEVVTLSLHGDRRGGRKTGRVAIARGETPVDPAQPPLLQVSFPVRGLRVSARSEKMYADLGYLDTVNDPDAMPGGFEAVGLEGDDVELLTTFGAADIRLFDQNGVELMTDPADRSRDITIQVAIPPEAWPTLEDEEPSTAAVEVPYYYYDEDTGIWKIHTRADGSPLHGVLVDNFGNELDGDDLIELQQVLIDADGAVVSLAYSPNGASPEEIVIYSRGSVNHFTSWNCDQGGRSRSFNYKLTDQQKQEMKGLWLRMVKLLGGVSFDSTQTNRGQNGRGNTHAGGPRTNISAASFVKDLLSRDASTQQAFLNNIPIMGDELLQAYMDALPGAIDDIAMDSERWTGFGAVLKSSEAIALMEQARSDGIRLDCGASRQACIRALQGVADIIQNHGNAEDAAKVLTKIAVEYYDPSKLTDIKSAMVNGVKIINSMAKLTGGNDSTLANISGKMLAVQSLIDTLPDPTSSDYAGELQKLAAAVKQVKAEAATMGARLQLRKAGRHEEAARLTRVYEPGAVAVPTTDEEIASLEKELEYDWEDIGGLLLNGNPMNRYQWGTYDGTGEFTETEPPANPEGGSEVAQLQYWDGIRWRVINARSDLGVDAAFIPVPNQRSYRDGTPDAPAVNLGTFELDIPSADPAPFRGRITVDGNAAPGLAGRTVRIRSVAAAIASDGTFEGQLPPTESPVSYGDDSNVSMSFSWGYYRAFPYVASQGAMDFGTIDVPEAILRPAGWSWNIDQAIGASTTVDASTTSLSGLTQLTYDLELYDSWQALYNGELPLYTASNETGSFPLPVLDDYGRYAIQVKIAGGGLSQTLQATIVVQNTGPEAGAFSVAPASPSAGDTVTVSVPVTDPDGDDVERVSMDARCVLPAGYSTGLQGRYEVDDQGRYQAIFETDKRDVLRVLEGSLECTVFLGALDSTGKRGYAEHVFTLAAKNFPPVVEVNDFPIQMDSPHRLEILPKYRVRFHDPNGDIAQYSLDCGDGSGLKTSQYPIGGWGSADNCEYANPGSYALTYSVADSAGQTESVTTTVVLWKPLVFSMTLNDQVPEQILQAAPAASAEDDLESAPRMAYMALPTTGNRSIALALGVSSPNGDGSFTPGSGTIEGFSYRVYRDGWYTIASENLSSGSAETSVTIDRPGVYRVYLDAHDAEGVWGSTTESFQVIAPFDVALTVDGDAPPDAYYLSTQTLSFAATSSPDLADQYEWSVKKAGDTEFSSLGSGAAVSTMLAAGNYTVRCEATDNDDTERPVVKDLQLTVYAPVTSSFGTDYVYPDAQDAAVALGDRYTLTASTTLPEGVTVTDVKWLVKPGTPGASFTSLQSDDPSRRVLVFQTEGTYDVSAKITDSRGLVSYVDQTVTVRAYPPVIDSLTASATSGSPPLAVSVNADAVDPDGEIVNYLWRVEGTPVSGFRIDEIVLQTAADDTPEVLDYTFAAEGSYTISLVVEDDSGRESAEASVAITVAYQPPTIDSLVADPSSGPADLTVNFTATASDSDGTIVSYAWDVGADGTVEQSGDSAVFLYTFTTLGSHDVLLTVTDSQGKTATRSASVYTYDQNAGITFQFKELRSDGLGPAMDFTPDPNNPYHHEMVGSWVSPGQPAVLDPAALTPVTLAPTLDGIAGFNGFYQADYGVYVYLAQIGGTGTYTVRLEPTSYATGSVPATYPAGYDCGTRFGTWIPPAQAPLDFWPEWRNTDAAGQVHGAAVIGTWDGVETCDLTGYDGYGYASGGAALTLSVVDSRAVPAVPGYSLSGVALSGGGIRLDTNALDYLAMDDQGRYLLPVIPGSDVALEFSNDDPGISQTLTVTLSAAQMAGSGVLALDVPASTTQALALTNVPGSGSLKVMSSQGSAVLWTSTPVTAGTSSVDVGVFDAATDGQVKFNAQDRSRTLSASGPSDLSGPIDVSAVGSPAAVSSLTLDVDTAAKTATVSFATDASACLVDWELSYDWGDAGRWDSMGLHLLTDGRRGSHTVSYVYPDTEESDNATEPPTTITVPGMDQVATIQVAVTCLAPYADYDAMLRELLEKLEYSNWYLQSFKGLVDTFHQPPSVMWQAGQ